MGGRTKSPESHQLWLGKGNAYPGRGTTRLRENGKEEGGEDGDSEEGGEVREEGDGRGMSAEEAGDDEGGMGREEGGGYGC
jgi:hypothetical protein